MTIYDDKSLAPTNEYRLEEIVNHKKKNGAILPDESRHVLRVYIAGIETNTIIEIEPEKGLPFYNNLRMSPEDRGRLRAIIEAQH